MWAALQGSSWALQSLELNPNISTFHFYSVQHLTLKAAPNNLHSMLNCWSLWMRVVMFLSTRIPLKTPYLTAVLVLDLPCLPLGLQQHGFRLAEHGGEALLLTREGAAATSRRALLWVCVCPRRAAQCWRTRWSEIVSGVAQNSTRWHQLTDIRNTYI